jgi:hypothetical protein
MKKTISLLLIAIILISCMPQVVKQSDKNYASINWEGGNFAYITYKWNGGKFDDALELIKKMDDLKKTRGLNELAIGRFPSGKEWQMGFIATAPLAIESINGVKIEQENIPAGLYAALKTKGYSDQLFIYWQTFKKWLIRDGFKIESPVYEIYKDGTFDPKIPEAERIGELRYKISK